MVPGAQLQDLLKVDCRHLIEAALLLEMEAHPLPGPLFPVLVKGLGLDYKALEDPGLRHFAGPFILGRQIEHQCKFPQVGEKSPLDILADKFQ